MIDDVETAPVDAEVQSRSRTAALGRPVAELTPGTRLGRFELRALLGRGGSSQVFAALDTDAQQEVALKVLRDPDAWRSAAAQRRAFLEEARALARLSHPGIVRVFDAGVLGGHPVIAMEKVLGQTFDDWLETGPAPSAIVATWLAVCRSVDAAHGVGIVHRDIKPTNVLVRGIARTTLLDFGLALAMNAERTASSVVLGSGGFTAPERLRGDSGGPAVDQYALAVLLAVGLGAPAPAVGSTPELPVDVRPALKDTITRALADDPQARFSSVGAFAEAVTRASSQRRLWATVAGSLLVVAAVTYALM